MLTGWEHITSKVIDGKKTVATGSGSFQGGGRKLGIHTTQGRNVEGSITTLFRNRSWPHFHIDPKSRRKIQYLETNTAAKSMSNNTLDGFPTNRSSMVQVEIEGMAQEAKDWPKADLEWIAECFNEIRADFFFPLNYQDFNSDKRLTDQACHEFAGILGHKHVPDNDHWDPGQLDVAYIVSKMGATSPIQPQGVIVTTFKTYSSTIGTDKDGRGYVDVVHAAGSDPKIALAQTNGNDPKTEGYPQLGTPVFLTAGFSGAFVRVTVVGAKPKSQFGFKLLCGW